MLEKRGQVTIFIIIALVLVVATGLFFVLRKTSPDFGVSGEANIDAYLKTCMEDKIKEGVELISLQGGHLEHNAPLYINFKFGDEPYRDISYLCYTQKTYVPCINREPMLIKHLNDELTSYISTDVESCFNALIPSLEKQGYDVSSEYNGFNVEFKLGRIIVEGDSEIVLTKTEETFKRENFKIVTLTKFYDLSTIVQEIVNQQAKFCHFSETGFMILYPEYYITKQSLADSTIIYTVEDRKSKEKFRFAVNGCIRPSPI